MTSTREDEIKAAIVVTPDAIAYLTPEINYATTQASESLTLFIAYLSRLDPELTAAELYLLAAGVIDSLPRLIQSDQNFIKCIKLNAAHIRSARQQ